MPALEHGLTILPNNGSDIYPSNDNFTYQNQMPYEMPSQELMMTLMSLDAHIKPFTILSGIVLNILVVILITTTLLSKYSGCTYLCVISVTDIGYLSVTGIYWLELTAGINITNREGTCQLFTYLIYSFQFLSASYLLAFAVDRYISVCLPSKRMYMCTPFRAKLVATSLGILAMYGYIYTMWFWSAVEQKNWCYLDPAYWDLGLVLLKLNGIFAIIIPYSLVIILTMPMVMGVFKQNGVAEGIPIMRISQEQGRTLQDERGQGKRMRLNIIYIVIVLLTLTLLVPAKISETLHIFSPSRTPQQIILSQVLGIMHYVYFFFKPLACVVVSSRFRYYIGVQCCKGIRWIRLGCRDKHVKFEMALLSTTERDDGQGIGSVSV